MALGPLPNVGNVARVRLNGSNQGTPWVALHYWHYLAGTVNDADMNTLAAGFGSAWDLHMKAAFGSGVTLDTVETWDLASRSGPQSSSAVGVSGSRPGTNLPVNIAAVTSWKVNFRWRGGHARTYWPAGVVTDTQQGHLWTTAGRAAFEAANGAYLNAVNNIIVSGQGGYLTLVRYVFTPAPGAPPQYFNPPLDLRIVDALIDPRLDTQRRRLGPDL